MCFFVNLVNDILTTYWGNSAWQWLFYLCLVVVFFIETDCLKKQLLFWYPLIVYLFLISPLWFKVTERFWRTDATPYLCRQFSLVPIVLVMAYAGTLLVRVLFQKAQLIGLCIACLIVVVFGSKLIYVHNEYGFEKSENAYKIPTDLMTMCDYMDKNDEDPVLAINTDYAYLIRQYDPSIHLLIGARAYENQLSNELGSDKPDVLYIMKMACSIGGDYVAVINKDSVRNAFLEDGFQPCLETPTLLLYECSGFPRVVYTYDKRDLVIREDYYDENNQLSLNNQGVASSTYTYNSSGQMLEGRYFGIDEQPIAIEGGFYGCRNEYDVNGMLCKYYYLGVDGNPSSANSFGYASVSLVRDSVGNVVEEYYYNESGDLTMLDSGYCGIKRQYDEFNRLKKLSYLGKDKEPIKLLNGQNAVVYDYSNYPEIREWYVDTNENLISVASGQYGMANEQKNGRIVYQLYLNKAGNPMMIDEGYSKVLFTYDIKGRLIKQSYYDTDGKLALCRDGYAGYRRIYNKDGGSVDVYFGLDGEEVIINE